MAQNSQAVIPDNIILVDGELNPVPTPEAGDSGKVLTVVDSDGTIGWSPVSASGTQLQADWSVTDNTSVQYIANKPDLSVYATTSSVTTALAGKQDTISDLSDIRSGAAAGATAVQPADLADYVEASSLAAVATSGSYNDLIDTPTIPSGDDLVPSATSADEGKVLTVDSEGSTAWVTPSAGTTYTAGTGIDISAQNEISIDTTTVATKSDLPSSSDLVPSSSSGDAGKVLTVDALGEPSWVTPSGGTTYSAGDGIAIDGNNVVSADVDGSTIGIDSTTKKIKLLSTIPAAQVNSDWDAVSGVSQILNKPSLATVATSGSYADLSNKPTIPTVDQTYSAVSTNAQSGVAVAGAIDGAVDVDTDNVVLTGDGDSIKVEFTRKTRSSSETQAADAGANFAGGSEWNRLYVDLNDFDSSVGAGFTPKFTIKQDINYRASGNIYLGFMDDYSNQWPSTTGMYTFGYTNKVTAQTLDLLTLFPDIATQRLGRYLVLWVYTNSTYPSDTPWPAPAEVTGWPKSVTVTEEYTDIPNIPASTSVDENKVLTVNASGNAVWAAPATVTVDQTYDASSTNAQSGTAVASAVSNAVSGLDEVPTVTSSDNGKVLKATYSGGAGSYAWATDSDTTYTAGNMINISNQNAIGVSTTAGITDIQQVAALPANPVATVLYLIPET